MAPSLLIDLVFVSLAFALFISVLLVRYAVRFADEAFLNLALVFLLGASIPMATVSFVLYRFFF